MALDDDIRHSERNSDAKQRAADQLRPAVRKLMAEILEIEESEIGAARDAIKDIMRARERREERKNETVMSSIKTVVAVAVGAIFTWLMSNIHTGSGKP